MGRSAISTRELASITGSIISLSPVFGSLCRILTRHCQINIVASPSWEFELSLDHYCVSELVFWLSNINNFNVKNCFKFPDHSHAVFSDASSHACGAVIAQDNMPICHRLFTDEEKSYSSTHRELLAIDFSLESFCLLLRNSKVKWYTDNQSTAKIVEVGSMNLSLHTWPLRFSNFARGLTSSCPSNGFQER